jgi:uncharacterized protein YbjQ (UPF0145 family)
MENKVIVTTTNSIENTEIEKYLDLISTNVVIGTNLFSDIGASLTDLFGGFSDSYQNKLQKIYNMAIDNLKLKAANIGANAILGLKIDFDEISGKGKSMFMISALGTAVLIKFKDNHPNELLNKNVSIISKDKLDQEVVRRNIISNLKNNKLPNQDEWIYLLNNPIEEISTQILDKYLNNIHYLNSIDISNELKLLLSNTINYFKVLNKEYATNILYEKLKDKPILILKIIETNNLFIPLKIIELIENDNIKLAIDCLTASMDYYSTNDLKQMEKIIEILENLPDKGKIESVKGILSKAKDKYICPNGHKSDETSEFCENENCMLNIKGLTPNDLKQIESFKLKVDSLSILISKI